MKKYILLTCLSFFISIQTYQFFVYESQDDNICTSKEKKTKSLCFKHCHINEVEDYNLFCKVVFSQPIKINLSAQKFEKIKYNSKIEPNINSPPFI